MAIGGIGTTVGYSAGYTARKAEKNTPAKDFANRIANVADELSYGNNSCKKTAMTNITSEQDGFMIGTGFNIYDSIIYTRQEINAEQELNFPIETERYKIEDASYVDGVPAYEIMDKETGRGLYIREDQLVIQKDAKTGLEFVINMDQPFSCNVPMTGELKSLLNGIAEKKGINLKEVPLQGGLTVNQDPKTGLRYLSIQGNEAKGMSVVATSKEDLEIIEKLADEFTKYEVSSQRSIAGLYALLEISGNLKREGDGMTFLTPNGITYIPYNGDEDKAWEIDIANSDYGTARKYLAMGIEASNYQTWLSKFHNAKLCDTDLEIWNHYNVNQYENSFQFRL